ncbi:hypothetical protein B484DRAFT_425437 [Ochromonadaceae sp. CCMP2298]|nr:hypothetical protein B484DRAFT_425437 [Ochromonadaceae sp. CCMP2298]
MGIGMGMGMGGGMGGMGNGDGIFFMDQGSAVGGTPMQGQRQGMGMQMQGMGQGQGQGRAQGGFIGPGDDLSTTSQASARSVDTVASADVAVLQDVSRPSKNLLLAASALLILLAPGTDLPQDLSWGAFLRLCGRADVSSLMRNLDPVRVHKVKVVAIKPLLEQLVDHLTYDGFLSNEAPLHEFAAVTKLVQWVRQFSTFTIQLHMRMTTTPIIPSKRKGVGMRQSAGQSTGQGMGQGLGQGTGTGQGGQGGMGQSGSLNIADLPVTKKLIPSASLQLAPYHSEVVTHLHKHPLLLALLAPYTHRGRRQAVAGEFDRVVVKVYDVVSSSESFLSIIIREFLLLLDELQAEFQGLAVAYFDPADRHWWAAHIGQILRVGGSKLQLSVSRRAIEDIIVDGIENDRPRWAAPEDSPSRSRSPTLTPPPMCRV